MELDEQNAENDMEMKKIIREISISPIRTI